MKKKVGKVDISALNVPPEKHEYETAKYFANRGFDVTFIKPHYINGYHNPDFAMAGKIWETKSPQNGKERTFESSLRKAIKQSEHIIIDFRRSKPSEEKLYMSKILKQKGIPSIKTLLVITRDGNLLTIKGKFDIM